MRISHSALQTYLECGYKYFLSYFWKLRAKGLRSPLCFGDAIDNGLNTLLETRDIEAAKEAFRDRWRTYRDKEIKFSKSDLDEHLVADEDFDTEHMKFWTSLNRRGLILLEEFNKQIMPRIKEVIKVQIDQVVKNDMGDELVIKTDFICRWEDDRIILFDNKTSTVKYEEDSVRKSEQLAIYYETLREQYNIQAAGYIVIPKKLRKIKQPPVDITVIIDQIDEETINNTLQAYDTVLGKIKAAEFPQNKDACIGKFGKCDYYDFCHHRKMDGLEENKWKK